MLGLANLAQRRPVFCALLGTAGSNPPGGGLDLYSALWGVPTSARVRQHCEFLLRDANYRLTEALRLAWERGV